MPLSHQQLIDTASNRYNGYFNFKTKIPNEANQSHLIKFGLGGVISDLAQFDDNSNVHNVHTFSQRLKHTLLIVNVNNQINISFDYQRLQFFQL